MNIARFAAVGISLLLVGCVGHPTDETLRGLFFRKEASFNKLVHMAHEDSKMTIIAPGFTVPNDQQVSFSTQRWDEYRALFREIGADNGIRRLDREDGVMFIVSATGIVGRGTAKGYAYSTKPLEPIVDSLDTARPQPCIGRKDCIAFRPIRVYWYLFFEIG